ncbi:MAG: TetR/AcrR family transcriptional regulator [Deltaproteobacteria bacterium]|nr:TetR/AcrR family transcriptional regulator [Deltaproteobacteria bacterium]MBW2362490.1 TetR/AcrR family transcriptional regulator [Deltaproteobacteria bacterium]
MDPSSSTPGARGGATLRLERRLGAAQIQRRNRLLEVARSLASEGGYPAVTVRDVAEQAGMGLATVYRYFSSKDHLIAEVHAARGQEVARELRAAPPAGEHAQERVVKACARLIAIVAQDLNLAAAGVMALTSGDPAASSSEQWQTLVIGPCLEAAFGEEDVGDRQEVCDLFGHLVFAVMVGLTNGQHDSDSAMAFLESAARRVLPARR